jgi:acyl-CoA reductase-like NAD-dependent aldehyde dehydrogenase
MASKDEETTVAAVPHIVKDLQRTVRSGITRTAEWRIQQLRAILKLVQENEERIIQVLAQDIGKPAHEAFLTEILVATDSCKLAIKELKKWMAPQKVQSAKTTTTTIFPLLCKTGFSTSRIMHDSVVNFVNFNSS